MTIAFLGAGHMAHGMIGRLLGAGFPVTVYNRSVEKVRPLEALGATTAATPRDAAHGADVVFASLSDDAASRAVWTGPEGVLSAHVSDRMIAIECSTLSHDWVLELAGTVRRRGLRYIDCPVAGRPYAAAAGQLVVFAGAEAADLEEVRPLLAPLSKEIFHFGPVGAGTAFKLIYNLMGATQIAALAEGLVAAEAAGIDLLSAARAFSTGATGSPHVVRHAAFMAEGRHEDPPAFTARGRLKDSTYGVQLAETLGCQAVLGRATVALFEQMVEAGMGGAADSRLIEAVRSRRVDVPPTSPPPGRRPGWSSGR